MNKILIVKLGAVGDVLRTMSILPGLREKHYPAEIDWLTYLVSKEVLANNSYMSNLFLWEERDNLGGYDLVVGLEDEREACELVTSVKAGKRIGAYLENGQITYSPSAWFDMSAISKYGLEGANELKKRNCKTYQQHMADLLGIKVSPYVFNLTEDEIEYGRKVVKDLGISKTDRVVGINTGAGKRWVMKSWGIEQTIDLVKKLTKEPGVVSLILGGEEEKERNKIISSQTGMPDAGVHSLRHFASIVNQCLVVLCSDSLAMHFAIALRRRVIAFFGPTPAAEIELYGLGAKLVSPIDCVVCYKKNCDTKPNCMDLLSVKEVFEVIKRQLS